MNEAEILDYLTTQGIDYEYQRHPAVLTMDEAERLALPHPECEARNLFVRESRTHRYFLLTAHARVDLKAFSRQQGLRSLSFASADELREILRLETGAGQEALERQLLRQLGLTTGGGPAAVTVTFGPPPREGLPLYLTPDCALRQEVRYAWPDPSQTPPPEGLLSLLHRACRLPEICVKSVETLDIGP